ncbi:hypothetical protein B0T16DRAFT_462788 [Cercophora newfieldiana]|uniref:Rhodopsin domain-containing protein n=1 Tax=Cercophora newfieldiana TaxID=92897 RepID=A0AA39XSZ2_9PEZI|nr:hypothetical protein B0T16DRAFT_462788 [Cercophora newfieldiana]
MFLLPRNGVVDGPHYETHDQDSYSTRILAACWVVGTLSTIFLALRMYCKVKRSRQPWYDDYVLIAAWLFQTADIILITVNVSLGVGQHISNLDRSTLHTLERNGNVSGTLSITAAALSKTSFGITLLRLTSRYMKWSIWFLLVTMNVALGLIYSALVDFALAILPWPLVWGLQMQRREKIGVAVAMSMGVFAGIGAVAKVVQLPNLSHGDFTYHESGILIWGTFESAVTIMAVSVPFLRILIVEARSSRGPGDHFAPQLKTTFEAGDERGLVRDMSGSEDPGGDQK